EVAPRAAHGPCAADETDTRRLTHPLRCAEEHGPDLGGRTDVRTPTGAEVDCVPGLFELNTDGARFGNDGVGAFLDGDHLVARHQLGVEIERRRVGAE